MRCILILGSAILLSSCATTNSNYYHRTVQSWNGGNVKNLAQRWGAPDRTATRPNGDTVYIYQSQSYRNFNSPSGPAVGVSAGAGSHDLLANTSMANMTWNRGAMSASCVTAFEITRTGKIVGSQIQGSSCYGNESFAQRMSNPTAKI